MPYGDPPDPFKRKHVPSGDFWKEGPELFSEGLAISVSEALARMPEIKGILSTYGIDPEAYERQLWDHIRNDPKYRRPKSLVMYGFAFGPKPTPVTPERLAISCGDIQPSEEDDPFDEDGWEAY